jgi:crotonobetainyl-CoA:carnitine CoA-transferase CaiB-like acyl-CoA transferase
LRALNPQPVYCSISGFGADRPGRTGRIRHRRAGASGFLKLPRESENPRVVGPAIADCDSPGF